MLCLNILIEIQDIADIRSHFFSMVRHLFRVIYLLIEEELLSDKCLEIIFSQEVRNWKKNVASSNLAYFSLEAQLSGKKGLFFVEGEERWALLPLDLLFRDQDVAKRICTEPSPVQDVRKISGFHGSTGSTSPAITINWYSQIKQKKPELV